MTLLHFLLLYKNEAVEIFQIKPDWTRPWYRLSTHTFIQPVVGSGTELLIFESIF